MHAEEKALAVLEEQAASPADASDYEAMKKLYAQLEAQRQRLDDCFAEWEQAETTYQAFLGEEVD